MNCFSRYRDENAIFPPSLQSPLPGGAVCDHRAPSSPASTPSSRNAAAAPPHPSEPALSNSLPLRQDCNVYILRRRRREPPAFQGSPHWLTSLFLWFTARVSTWRVEWIHCSWFWGPRRLPGRTSSTRWGSSSKSWWASVNFFPFPLEIFLGVIIPWVDLVSWFQTADIDERSIRREDPEELVMVLAEAKVECFFCLLVL
jgi:hypothetical protein